MTKMKTTVIKLYDNEGYDYPLIEIKSNSLKSFNKDLNNYRKQNEDYNLDDFFNIISNKNYFIKIIIPSNTIFF